MRLPSSWSLKATSVTILVQCITHFCSLLSSVVKRHIHALWLFVPGHSKYVWQSHGSHVIGTLFNPFRSHQVIPLQTTPLRLHQLPHVKLIGICTDKQPALSEGLKVWYCTSTKWPEHVFWSTQRYMWMNTSNLDSNVCVCEHNFVSKFCCLANGIADQIQTCYNAASRLYSGFRRSCIKKQIAEVTWHVTLPGHVRAHSILVCAHVSW